jgi:hypothetical protein
MAAFHHCLRGPRHAQSGTTAGVMLKDVPSREFVRAGSVEELKAKGSLVLHGGHGRPAILK